MASNNIDEFKYLWDGSEIGWRLLNVSGSDWNSDLPYAIVNVETRELMSISDGELKRSVVTKMLDEQILVINKMPPGRDWH